MFSKNYMIDTATGIYCTGTSGNTICCHTVALRQKYFKTTAVYTRLSFRVEGGGG
jgi:hypothetical protein